MSNLRRSINFIRNNSRGLVLSFILFVLAGFLLLSELSYNASDNSLLNFTDQENKTHNWLGQGGAYYAGFIMQSIGLSYLLVVAHLFFSAFKLLQGKKLTLTSYRISALLTNILAFSGLLALREGGQSGFLGLFVRNELMEFIDPVFVGALLLVGFASTFLFAINLQAREAVKILKILASIVLLILYYTLDLLKTGSYYIRRFIYRLKHEETAPTERRGEANIHSELPAAPPIKRPEKLAVERKLKSLNIQPKFVFDSSDFNLPSTALLNPLPAQGDNRVSGGMLEQSSKLLMNVLGDFGVKGEMLKVSQGPVVTLYEMEPAAGTKSSRVIGLADDIARSMSAISARISVRPGKNALGIELPNAKRKVVYLRELLETKEYTGNGYALPLVLGQNISGEAVIADLAKMPHLLVAGTTGSGKSVAINTMILSLLFKHSPQQCKFIMIDPKMLELSVYDDIPHLLTPVVTEPRKAVSALKWVVREMEERYRSMSTIGVRNIQGYNETIERANNEGRKLTKKIYSGVDPATDQPIYKTIELDDKPLPQIVVIVDEMADLMLVAGKDIEGSIQRLAQMARAAGIHLIMATQRPSVDVITGVIKANFPTRISFQVTSKIDSRTILGEQGAEQLLGQGDMLYMSGGGKIERVHGPFVSDNEVESIVNYLKKQGKPQYVHDVTVSAEDEGGGDLPFSLNGEEGGADLYEQAVRVVKESKRASISYVQRYLKVGYNRAANLIEQMEKDGIVTPPNHQGKREVVE